jgi:aromatic amino acid aminotransferase I
MTLSLPFVQKSVFVPGFTVRQEDALLPLSPYTQPPKTDALVPDLGEELQYSGTYGQKHFVKWIKEHVTSVHNPKYENWEVCCTAGNTDGVDGVMRALLDRGDHVLVEEFGKYCRGTRGANVDGSIPRSA